MLEHPTLNLLDEFLGHGARLVDASLDHLLLQIQLEATFEVFS